MDQAFFSQLEKTFTNVGTDIIWKRKIGGRDFLLSPIPIPGQEKVNETLSNSSLKNNVVLESKRVVLSWAIVGLDGLDLTVHRHEIVFPLKGPDGRDTKVALHKFVYEKLKTWGGQLVDDVFTVYADLLESLQRENLRDVKFENAKDPEAELADLEARVSELRKMLGKPPLVESSPKAEEPTQDSEENPDLPSADFNPFRPMSTAPSDGQDGLYEPPGLPVATIPAPPSRSVMPPPSAPSVPTAGYRLPAEDMDVPGLAPAPSLLSTPIGMAAYRPPSLRANDTIDERKSDKPPSPMPSIDRVVDQSRNPRFAAPKRG